jgi:DNA-binding MarR family transcriptional regulator
VRDLSRILFGGAQYRLEVGAALSSEEVTNIKDLAERLGDPPGTASVNTELKRLEEAGLLQRLPRVGSDRRVHLRVRTSSYWETCRELIELVQAGVPQQRRKETDERSSQRRRG